MNLALIFSKSSTALRKIDPGATLFGCVCLCAARRQAVWLVVGLLAFSAGCSKKTEKPLILEKDEAALFPETFHPESLGWASPNVCAGCHAAAHNDWLRSHHAIANRLIDPQKEEEAFSLTEVTDEGNAQYRLSGGEEAFAIVEQNAPAAMPKGHDSPVIGVIGETPIRQYLVPTDKGRLQTQALTWDPSKKEWFNVFGDENRRPTEWGHWTQQGMNWNANCAWCHMTDFQKNYAMSEDTYHSTWLAQSVTCVQCHSGMEEHVESARSGRYTTRATEPDLGMAMENCATCHARREELTAHGFKAGDHFFDHYRLTLPDAPGAYFADGQAREENYVYASFMMSRMADKGVTCMDCHNPHSGEAIFPVENNALCMRCHATGQNEALIINPVEHSHHGVDSPGNRCVACHMPERVYMERDWRRDHGFTSPDPQLTLELGAPNACNGCHDDQSTEWAVAHVNTWYGNSERRQMVQRRARALTRAHAGHPDSLADLKDFFASEENVYWQSTWMRLLQPFAAEDSVRDLALEALEHASPLLRDSGLGVLAQRPDQLAAVQATLEDDSRLVRNRAAEALLAQFDPSRTAFQEWMVYAETNADRPGGALRRAELAAIQGDVPLVKQLVRQAVSFDRENAYLYYDAAILLDRVGEVNEALNLLTMARRIAPDLALLPYSQGLLYAERMDYRAAEQAISDAVGLDPDQARWWYNLAMIYQYLGEPDKAYGCINRAIELEPENPEFLLYRERMGASQGLPQTP